jgi:dihydrofolate reductase
MSRLVAFVHLTLDGVMQAPGHPNEDRRGGFQYGGWEQPYGDPVMAEKAGEGIEQGGALLLGRRTYEKFAEIWPNMPEDNQFTAVMNDFQKYVASRTLEEPLSWKNSILLKGAAEETVPRLKEQLDKDVVILGSGEVVRSLLPLNVIDEFVLPIHPLVLGTGRRLFTDNGSYAAFELVDTKTTTTGVVIATYRPAEPAEAA